MPIVLDGTAGITTPEIVSTGGPLVVNASAPDNSVVVNASGNVGIGTSSPAEKLDVGGLVRSFVSGGSTRFVSTDGTVEARFGTFTTPIAFVGSQSNHPFAFYTNGSERARIGAAGGFTVSVGDMFASSAGGLVGALGTYNTATGSAANVHILSNGFMLRSTSSLKYKRDVQDAPHGLAEVMALRPVTYKGKNPMDGESVFGGLIAEEVHEAGLTEFVQYADDGTPDALAYGNMVSLCVKAIQELKAINDAQAQTIESLTARVVALEQA